MKSLALLIKRLTDDTLDPKGPRRVDRGTKVAAQAILQIHDITIPQELRTRDYAQAAKVVDLLTPDRFIEDIDYDEALVIAKMIEALEASLAALHVEQRVSAHNITHLEGVRLQNRVLREWMNVFITFNESFHHSPNDMLRLFKFLVKKTRFGEFYDSPQGRVFMKGLYAEVVTYLYAHMKYSGTGGKVRAPSQHEDMFGAIDLIYEGPDGELIFFEAKTDPNQTEELVVTDIADPFAMMGYRNGLQRYHDSTERDRRLQSAERFAQSVEEQADGGYIVTVKVPEFLK